MINPNVIRYFRECYLADHRRSVLLDIHHNSIDQRITIEGKEDLLNGFLFSISLDPGQAEKMLKGAYLHRAEKELLYCSILIVGKLKEEEGEIRTLCAPLFIHTATIEENGEDRMLRIDPESRQINYGLLDLIGTGDREGHIGANLAAEIGTGALTFAELGQVIRFLKDWAPGVDCSDLYLYPELLPERELRTMLNRADPSLPLRAVPFSTLLLLPKSTGTRGVLNELDRIAAADRFSEPLQQLLFPEQADRQREGRAGRTPGRTPAILSNAQRRGLESAGTEALSMIVGPPGTGKSFTIACIAMEHLDRGESVLIASKMNHAVDVVGTIIEERLGIPGMVVRAGRSRYLRDLKAHLEGLLSGMLADDPGEGTASGARAKRVRRLQKEVERMEGRFVKGRKRWIRYGRLMTDGSGGVFGKIGIWWGGWRARRSHSLRSMPDDLERLSADLIDEVIALLTQRRREMTAKTLKKNRAQLQGFLSGLRARRGGRREEIFDRLDFRTLFRVFPLWLTNLADIHRTLPLQPELFDLAIIDEATQCDIAACLPVLQRARRVVVTGDPKQLRHLSFLPVAQQRTLQEQYDLKEEELFDYRSLSILDIVDHRLGSQEGVCFLDEHFRSLPEIIRFSNREFYHNRLRIMKEFPRPEDHAPLKLISCDGRQRPDGANEIEGERLFGDLLRLVEREGGLPEDRVSSIGILSPFRVQADYLAKRLESEIGYKTIERHDIMVGTSYTFQGEERDVLFISLAVDASAHHARLRYLNREDAFNVSITRGAKEQRVYASVHPHDLSEGTLLRRYLDHFNEGEPDERAFSSKGKSEHSGFLRDVAAALEERGYRIYPHWHVAGLVLDLMVQRDDRCCGVDLMDRWSEGLPLERYRMFLRAGLRVIPLTHADWLTNREASIASIEAAVLSSEKRS